MVTYRKVDVISQEEFDSQRGETDEPTAENEMVFPLDLPEPVKTEGSGVAVKPLPVVQGGEREEECAVSHSKDLAQPKKDTKKKSSREKRARFYPLPNKQELPTKVGCWW